MKIEQVHNQVHNKSWNTVPAFVFKMSMGGLEPPQLSPHAPQACVSTVPPHRQDYYSIFKIISLKMWWSNRFTFAAPVEIKDFYVAYQQFRLLAQRKLASLWLTLSTSTRLLFNFQDKIICHCEGFSPWQSMDYFVVSLLIMTRLYYILIIHTFALRRNF